jgi:2-amino-4-hydroxy-6-hydroxymethyldihydropteridine diphosphokinase
MAQPPYLNQMVAVRTRMEPRALLRALHGIEAALGRVRASRWAPRTIDLDLVRYGDRRVSDAHLTLPHPGLPKRDFWQRELSELRTILGDAR